MQTETADTAEATEGDTLISIEAAYRRVGGKGGRQAAYRWANSPGAPPKIYISPRRIRIDPAALAEWCRAGGVRSTAVPK